MIMLKKIIILFLCLVLIVNVNSQDEANDATSVQLEDAVDDGGITPDSVFYGLDNAWERVSLAFTFNKEKKAEKELKYARERLKEVKLMVEENKLDAAQKAEEKHTRLIEKLKERIDGLDDKNEGDLETNLEFENEIEEQEAEIDEIKTKIEIKGDLSVEQRELLDKLIESLKANNQNVRLKIESKRDEIKVKLKERGVDEEKIREKINKKRDEGLERALKLRIEHVQREIEKSGEYLERNDREELKKHLEIAEEILDDADDAVEKNEFENAKELILRALKLAVSVRGEPAGIEEKKNELKEAKKEVKELLKERREKVEDEDKKESEDEEIDEEKDEEDYFTEKMQNEVINKRGMPIEGFTPSMFLDVFPKLEKKDFHGVKAFGGAYYYIGGELKFETSSDRFSDDGLMVSSADGSVGEDGMEKLLENLSQRFGVKIDGEKSVDRIVDHLK